jgi:hypothetical protein
MHLRGRAHGVFLPCKPVVLARSEPVLCEL